MGWNLERVQVLVADDERLIRELVQDALEDAGFGVRLAASGGEAIEVLADDEVAWAAMVTDIRFGSEPDGWAVATTARERHPGIPIVYMTGDSGHEWSAYGVPNSIVVTKPFAPAQIVVALASLLNRNDGEG